MPTFAHRHSPRTWFGSEAGQPLLAAAQPRIEALLATQPALPQLWLGAYPGAAPSEGRVVRLHREADGFAGPMRCRLPLPLPTDAFANVVVQHVLDVDAVGVDALLDEVSRVLENGGKLWLFALNPYSPYRWRWRNSGLHARPVFEWESALRRAGLLPLRDASGHFGPVWNRDAEPSPHTPPQLRALSLLVAEKRVPMPIFRPLPRWRWLPQLAPALQPRASSHDHDAARVHCAPDFPPCKGNGMQRIHPMERTP